MLEFEYLWVFALLPGPVLVWLLLPPYRERQESVRVPLFQDMASAVGRPPSRGAVVLRRNLLQWVLAPLVWAFIVVALARPVWVEDPVEKIESARDLLIAVDLSGSMETRDMFDPEGRRIDRLEAVKQVLVDFVGRREGDRIGLLLFGTAPYLQVPFTVDHEVVAALLEEAQVAMTGPQTMLGDAIGLAIKVFEESEARQRVLILLTDGNDTGSSVPPDKAAEIASGRDITIYTIGFGDPRAGGEGLFDAEALEAIAINGGGVSFMAGDREALERVYLELDQIEPQEYETLSYRPTRPLYPWPLGAALALLLTYHAAIALTVAVRGRVRRHG